MRPKLISHQLSWLPHRVSGRRCGLPPAWQCRCSARSRVALGIDLGTTNSAVAYVEHRQVHLLRDSSGQALVPSVVSFTPEGQPMAGAAAQQRAAAHPEDTFASTKVLLGQQYDASLHDRPGRQGWTGDAEGQLMLPCPALGRHVTPTELSGLLLQHLLQTATAQLGPPAKLVVTVPARFSAAQRQATLQAARLAGAAPELLQEPIAAALASGPAGKQRDEVVLVFDLGGGTLDVSLLDSFEGALEVLASHGDAALGGDDFDAAFADWLLQRHAPQLAAQPSRQDAGLRRRLLASACAAKLALSASQAVTVEVPSDDVDSWQQASVSRQDFQWACRALITRAWATVEELGRQARLTWARRPGLGQPGEDQPQTGLLSAQGRYAPKPRRVDRVVLVGGSSRMPWVAQGLAAFTGLQVELAADPQTSVALGAAFHAGVLAGLLSDTLELSDSTYQQNLHDRSSGSY